MIFNSPDLMDALAVLCGFVVHFFLKLIISCRLCVIYAWEGSDSSVLVTITQIAWTTLIPMSAVPKRPLNLITHLFTQTLTLPTNII